MKLIKLLWRRFFSPKVPGKKVKIPEEELKAQAFEEQRNRILANKRKWI